MMNAPVSQPAEPKIMKRELSYGEFALSETQRLTFRQGLPGFEHLHRFTVAELTDFSPFSVLLSDEEPEISMMIINARFLKIWESIRIHPREIEPLGAQGLADIDIWVILRTDPATHAFTANVKAPLVVNRKTGQSHQVILDNDDLSVQYPLSEGLI